jgi:hypothetical protein
LSPVINSAFLTDRRSADPALRAVTAAGLITMGIIHAVEIQGELGGAVWLSVGFILLAAAGPLAGVWLLIQPTVPAWVLAGLTCLLAALGYMATRSFAVPGDHDDVGNWLEPLGLVALITEWLVVILVAVALGTRRETGGGSRHDDGDRAGRGRAAVYRTG